MTDTLTPNLPELKRLNMWVQEQAQLEPGARIWMQNAWVMLREETPMCQSAYCVAGMAIVRAGHKLVEEKYTVFDGRGSWQEERMMLDGVEVGSADVTRSAEEILGIDSVTADDLFYQFNKAADINNQIRRIFTKAGANYDTVEPAPDLEIEIKAAEAVRPQLLPTLTNA